MIYVKIRQDIRQYKSKMLFGLTGRQLICAIIGITTGTLLNTFAKKYIGADLASYLTIVIELPVFAIGFITIQGMPAEQFFRLFVKNMMSNNKTIVFSNNNVYSYIQETIEQEEKEKIKDRIKRYISILKMR